MIAPRQEAATSRFEERDVDRREELVVEALQLGRDARIAAGVVDRG